MMSFVVAGIVLAFTLTIACLPQRILTPVFGHGARPYLLGFAFGLSVLTWCVNAFIGNLTSAWSEADITARAPIAVDAHGPIVTVENRGIVNSDLRVYVTLDTRDDMVMPITPSNLTVHVTHDSPAVGIGTHCTTSSWIPTHCSDTYALYVDADTAGALAVATSGAVTVAVD